MTAFLLGLAIGSIGTAFALSLVMVGLMCEAAGIPWQLWRDVTDCFDRQIAHLKAVRPRLEAMAPREREAAT